MPTKEKTFEENLQDLEEIVTKLESGDVALEDALKEFQRGMILSDGLKKTLEEAEKVLATSVKSDGTEEKFESTDD
ncbi:MAG: exodeoxyribonuclease VII small subunit [Streptococcaceae bacterium]|nr:exodeoxyribonuclease VII small subunit [Streptococcaceae bacterium]